MARSIGEAAAVGLESGFRLAMDASNMQRQRKREDKADELAAENRSLAMEDRTRRLGREDTQAKLGALAQQEQMLAQEAAGYEATPPDQATQADFARRLQQVRQAKGSLLAQDSGLDAQDLRGQATRAKKVVLQGLTDFSEGLDGGDRKRLMSGLNTLLARELNTGVGQPSPHGGKIVGKRLVDFAMDPNSTPENPRVIPTLEVFVDGGNEFRGPRQEGVPEGATGSYRAPVTRDRSTSPNDPVLSIALDDAMSHFEKKRKLVEILDSPEGEQLLREDPNAYAQALASLNIGKKSQEDVKVHPIPRGGSALVVKKGRDGKTTQEVVQGNPMSSGSGSMNQQLDGIDRLVDEGTLTEAEGVAAKRALKDKTVTGTKAQGLAKGVTGGTGGAGGGESLKEREQKRKELKDRHDIADKAADNARTALRDFRAQFGLMGPPEPSDKAKYKAYKEELDDLTRRATKAAKRVDDIATDMEALDKKPEAGGLAKDAPAKPGALTKDAAAKKFGF